MSQGTWIVLGLLVAIVGIVTLFFAVRLAIKLVRVRRLLSAAGAKGKWVFWGAMAYLVFPFDILPDPIYLDDMAVLSGALIYLNRLVQKQESLRGGLPHAQRIATQVAARRRQSRV